MTDVIRLNEAFSNFTEASRALESSYQALQERIIRLSAELEARNRQLSEALANAEENKDYLRAVLYNIEEAIIVVDSGDRVTMMNRAAERLLGTGARDALGRRFSSMGLSLERDGSDTVLECGGKRHFVIFSRSEVVDSADRLRGSVILIRDVTRLRELEVQHERNKRLIAMGEMAAKIVHEVRNPLCSIELYATMLEQDLSNTAHRDLAAGISSGISSLNTILANMLAFARPHRPARMPVRLDRIVGDALRMAGPFIEARGVRIAYTGQDCIIEGDGELLKQVLLNIIINAVQAVRDAGTVAVTIRRENGNVSVIVQDNGTGISRGNLERIFDPFFTTKDSGTGLGLAIASSIMQAHHGSITVESEEGVGSTFLLHFPVPVVLPVEVG
jgi:signal transduction histidine kinase